MKHNNREYLIMVMSGILTMFSGGFIWPIFAAYVRTEFNASLHLVGLAVSGYFLLRMLTEFPIGVLSDRTGPKMPLIAGRVLSVIGAFVSFQTKNVGVLIVARIVWGIGDASFFCIGTSYVSKLFSSEKRGRALGTFQAVEMIGNLLGQALGGYFADRYGLRMNFLASAIMTVTALVMVTFIKGTAQGPFKGSIASLMPSWGTIRQVMNRTVVVICLVNVVCMMINNGLLGTIMPIFSTENIGLSLSQYSLMVSLSTIGNITGNLVGGVLSDKVGRKKILIAGFVIGVLAISGLSVFRTLPTLLFAMFLMGMFWGTVYGAAPAYIADMVAPEIRGIGIGIYRTFFDLGGLIGPVIMSGIVGLFGGERGYLFSFYFCIILVVGLIALSMMLKEKKPTSVS
ncbi:MAG: MFS transporter [Spirochaetales bacterium]|nr:MFS transporter [Spirochaetales bacterium]